MNLLNTSALAAILAITTQQYVSAFAPLAVTSNSRQISSFSPSALFDQIVSPFDNSGDNDGTTTTTTEEQSTDKLVGPLDLTWDNVEAVLDEMRPFLIQDGGNVVIQDIDGPVVRLELQVGDLKI